MLVWCAHSSHIVVCVHWLLSDSVHTYALSHLNLFARPRYIRTTFQIECHISDTLRFLAFFCPAVSFFYEENISRNSCILHKTHMNSMRIRLSRCDQDSSEIDFLSRIKCTESMSFLKFKHNLWIILSKTTILIHSGNYIMNEQTQQSTSFSFNLQPHSTTYHWIIELLQQKFKQSIHWKRHWPYWCMVFFVNNRILFNIYMYRWFVQFQCDLFVSKFGCG